MSHDQIDLSDAPDERLWSLGFAIVTVAVVFVLSPRTLLLLVTLPIAAIVGGIVGWKWARQRYLRLAIARIEKKGGIDWLLDQSREMLTLWIPLDHSLTEKDKELARALGDSFKESNPTSVAKYSALETCLDKVGLAFCGSDAERMVADIRDYFQDHCPRGSYITRLRLADDVDPDTLSIGERWPSPVPLFEDDEISVKQWHEEDEDESE